MGNKPTCPQCVCEKPTPCPKCAFATQKSVHDTTNMVGKLINNYLDAFIAQDQSLGVYQNCSMGILKNIKLCHLVEFDTPTKVSCALKVTLHDLKGAENIRISHLDYQVDPTQNTFELQLTIDFGQLVGTMSMVP
jgi:hypothetical protein